MKGGLRSFASVLAIPVFASLALAQCPIPEGGTLFIQAPLGDLSIDTSGSDRIELQVSPAIEVEENCFEDHVDVTGVAPERVYEPVLWQIRVPPTINLDLRTFAGTIRIASTEGSVVARNTGGSIVAGDVGGSAAMSTQGGSISAGDIGGNAEFRSELGRIEIGNVAGDAELATQGGSIKVGTVSGQINAETAGGNIEVEESQGDLVALTVGGDIRIGTALGRVTAKTAGGNIICEEARGPFDASTDLGDIRLGRGRSWIEATAGNGDIEAYLVPTSLAGDLHVRLETNSGNIQLGIPDDLPADIEAIVDRTMLRDPNVRSDFPLERVGNRRNLPPSFDQQFTTSSPWTERTVINGGGNEIQVRTSRGSIGIVRIQR